MRFDAGLAVTDVTVIDGTGRDPQPGRTVVVLEGRIAAVRPADEVALGPDVRVIAGRGRYLIPGLWDMHAHLTEPAALPLLTRHGVTGARHMYSMSPVFPGKLAFDPAGPTHPRTVGSTHMLDGRDNPFRWPANTNVITVTDPAGAGEAVGRAVRLGNDQIKVYPMLTGPAYTAVMTAARERGLDVVGHLPKAVPAAAASDAGQRSIEHLDGVAVGCSAHPDRWTAMRNQAPRSGPGFDDLSGWRVQLAAHDDFDDQQAAKLFATFVRNGTYHVPTLVQMLCVGPAPRRGVGRGWAAAAAPGRVAAKAAAGRRGRNPRLEDQDGRGRVKRPVTAVPDGSGDGGADAPGRGQTAGRDRHPVPRRTPRGLRSTPNSSYSLRPA